MYKFLITILTLVLIALGFLGILKYHATYLQDQSNISHTFLRTLFSSKIFNNTTVRELTHTFIVEAPLSRDRSIAPILEEASVTYIEEMIPDRSMVPIYYPDDVVSIDTGYYQSIEPERDDLIAFSDPLTDVVSIKRVRGVSGDTLRIEERAVYVNDTLIVEGTIGERDFFELNESYIVPAGFVFVLGDNVFKSIDSRDWGFLPIERIVGKVQEVQ